MKKEATYKADLYKIRLVRAERDVFGNPVSSNEWDKIGEAMDADLQTEVFKFVHPKDSNVVYRRHYMMCPVKGNTLLAVGKIRRTLDFAMVRITLKSVLYKEPYLVFENYSPAFRNTEILREMVTRAFNWVLEQYGLEVILEPWDTKGESIHWLKDSWISYIQELKNHPEEGEKCMGFEEAVMNDKQLKEVKAKKEASKKGKKQIKSDRIEDYIRLPHKEKIVRFLKEKTKGLNIQKDIARPFRFLYDRGITHHIPYKAVIKAIPEIHLKIRESRYNDWTNIQRTSYDDDPKYKDLEKEIESVLQSDDSLN